MTKLTSLLALGLLAVGMTAARAAEDCGPVVAGCCAPKPACVSCKPRHTWALQDCCCMHRLCDWLCYRPLTPCGFCCRSGCYPCCNPPVYAYFLCSGKSGCCGAPAGCGAGTCAPGCDKGCAAH